MSRPLRFGVLGCGNIARQILPALMQGRGYQVTACAARDLAHAAIFARRFHLRPFPSYAALLASPDIDAVYIALPESLHAPWAIAAARAKKHILCEKTLAPTLRQARAMLSAAKRHRVRLMEAFMWRHSPGALALQRAARGLGRLKSVHASFGFLLSDKRNYRNFKRFGGGCLNDIGCYTLNAARLLLGEPLHASCSLLGATRTQADMHGSAWLEFPGKALATLDFSFSGDFHEGVSVVGDKGKLEFPSPFVRQGRHEIRVSKGGVVKVIRPKKTNHYKLMFEAFAREVRRQRGPGGLEREALAQAEGMDLLRKTARNPN